MLYLYLKFFIVQIIFINCILVNDALQMFLNCFKSIQFNLVSLNLLFNIVYTNKFFVNNKSPFLNYIIFILTELC